MTLQRTNRRPLTLLELLDPLRLPGRLVAATDATVSAAQFLPRLPALVIARLDSLEHGMHEVVRTLAQLLEEIDRIEATIEPQAERVGNVEAAVHRLEERLEALLGEVQDASEHLPNHGAGGPIDRMRGALKSQT